MWQILKVIPRSDQTLAEKAEMARKKKSDDMCMRLSSTKM